MALIAIAADKGAPGVTTAALALAATWPRPVLLVDCDPAGGDLVYRFPAAGGGQLDPRRGLLSLAVAARRGMHPRQVWEHAQKLHGGLDVLAGVTNAEQGAGLSLLWGAIGKALAALPQADVIADCGRLGADGPLYDLLVEATTVALVTRAHLGDVIRLRDRAAAFASAAERRGRRGFGAGVVVVADSRKFRAALGEVNQVLSQANAPATVLGGLAYDTKGADLLRGEWRGSLDRTLLIKSARELSQRLAYALPPVGGPSVGVPSPGGPSLGVPSPGGPSLGVPSPGGPSVGVPSPGGPSVGVPSPGGPSLGVPSPAGPSVGVPAAAAGPPLSGSAAPGPPAPGAPEASPPAYGAGLAAGASRSAFGRVLGGRPGKHQAGPGHPSPARPGAAQAGAAQAGAPQAGAAQAGRPETHAQAGASAVPASQAVPAPSAVPAVPAPPAADDSEARGELWWQHMEPLEGGR